MRVGSYLGLLIILFIDFIGMILLVSRTIRYVIFELFLLVLFLLLSVIMMVGVYKNKRWAWKIASLFFLLLLINLAFVYLNSWGIYVFSISSLLAAIGFIISVSNIQKEKSLTAPPPPVEEEPKEVKEAKVIPYGKKTKESFRPGKFIASKRGAVYHKPRCDWAKRIKTPVWFNSEAEARRKGYKAHSCLK